VINLKYHHLSSSVEKREQKAYFNMPRVIRRQSGQALVDVETIFIRIQTSDLIDSSQLCLFSSKTLI
jgi:hypothetical protein